MIDNCIYTRYNKLIKAEQASKQAQLDKRTCANEKSNQILVPKLTAIAKSNIFATAAADARDLTEQIKANIDVAHQDNAVLHKVEQLSKKQRPSTAQRAATVVYKPNFEPPAKPASSIFERVPTRQMISDLGAYQTSHLKSSRLRQ